MSNIVLKMLSPVTKIVIVTFSLFMSYSCSVSTNRENKDREIKEQILEDSFEILNSEFISGKKSDLNEGMNLLFDNENLFLDNSSFFNEDKQVDRDTLATQFIIQTFNYLMRLDDPEKALEFNDRLEKRYDSEATMGRILRKNRIKAKLLLNQGDTIAAEKEISSNLKLLNDSINPELLQQALNLNESEFYNLTQNYSPDNHDIIDTYYYLIAYFLDYTLVSPKKAKTKLGELSKQFEMTEYMEQNILSIIDEQAEGALWAF